jgi:ABC-type transport system involved in cytochrome bd biosynthesis fused ATPase/permease subunit
VRGFDRRLLRIAPSTRIWTIVLAALIALTTLGTVTLCVGVAGLLAGWLGAASWPYPLALLFVGVAAKAAGGAGRDALAARAGAAVEAEARGALLTAIGNRPAREVAVQRAARASLAGARLGAVADAVGQVLPATIAATMIPAALLLVIVILDPWSGLVIVIALPVVIVFLILVGMLTRDKTVEQWTRLEALSGRFLDLIQGLPSLRIYGRADAQADQVRRDSEDYRRGSVAVLRTAFLSGFVLDVGATLSVALVAVGVGLRLDAGHIGIRTGFLVLLLTPEVFAPIRALGSAYHLQVSGESAVDEIVAALDAPTLLAPAPAPAGFDGVRNVTVQVPGRDRAVLRGLTLLAARGEVVAITGRSGIGKSTVLGLLLGHLRPSEGTLEEGGGIPRGSAGR